MLSSTHRLSAQGPLRALLALLTMLASAAAAAAPVALPADLTVLFTGDNAGELEPCG